MKPLTSYTIKLEDGQAKGLLAWLRSHDFEFREAPHARFAAAKEKVNVVFYESGKLVVPGKGTQEFVEFVLEPQILGEARVGYEAVLNPEILLPRLGRGRKRQRRFLRAALRRRRLRQRVVD